MPSLPTIAISAWMILYNQQLSRFVRRTGLLRLLGAGKADEESYGKDERRGHDFDLQFHHPAAAEPHAEETAHLVTEEHKSRKHREIPDTEDLRDQGIGQRHRG